MPKHVLRTSADLTLKEIRTLYSGFDLPVTDLDCGQKCAPYNPSSKPFCCDISHAVPVAYQSEWRALKQITDLWYIWDGNECELTGMSESNLSQRKKLNSEIPSGMIYLACKGPNHCQRENRLISCRQFPFFPYVTSDYCFLGLAYDWAFESKCWLIDNLGLVTEAYREEFIRTYDNIFALFQDEFDSYATRSEEMREQFIVKRRRIPLLHRDGSYRLISPNSERLHRVRSDRFPRLWSFE